MTVALYSGAFASTMHTHRWRSLNAKLEYDTCTLITLFPLISLAQLPHVPYHACLVVQGPTLWRQLRRPRPNPRLTPTSLMNMSLLTQHPRLKGVGTGRYGYIGTWAKYQFWMFVPSGNGSASVSLVDPWLTGKQAVDKSLILIFSNLFLL